MIAPAGLAASPPIVRTAVRPYFWPLFVALLLLSLGLRTYALSAHSFWMDEFFAMEISTGRGWANSSFPLDTDAPVRTPLDFTQPSGFHPVAIWKGQAQDAHPPLHFILLALWREAFGGGEAAARSLSVIFSVCVVAAVGLAVKQLNSGAAALWAMAILALSGLQIAYAQEARNYTMMLAILYTLAWLVLRAQRRGTLPIGEAIAAGVLMLLATLTHYLSIPSLVVLAIYAAFALRGRARVHFFIAATIAGVVFLGAWGPILLQQQHNNIAAKMRWMSVDPSHGVAATLKRLAVWPWDAFVFDRNTPWKLRYPSILVLLLPIALCLRDRRIIVWVLLTSSALAPALIGDLMEHTDRMGVWRYTLAAGPALATALVVAADRWRWSRHAAPAIVVLLCVVMLRHAYDERNINFRPAAQYVEQKVQGANDVIVITADPAKPWVATTNLLGLSQYAHWSAGQTPGVVVLSKPATPALLARLSRASRVVMLDTCNESPTFFVPTAWVSGNDFKYLFHTYFMGKPDQAPITPNAR